MPQQEQCCTLECCVPVCMPERLRLPARPLFRTADHHIPLTRSWTWCCRWRCLHRGGNDSEAREELVLERVRVADQDEGVEWGPKVEGEELLDAAGDNPLISAAHACKPHTPRLGGAAAPKSALLDEKELLEGSVDGHVPGGHIHWPPASQALERRFLHLDVQEAQRVQAPLAVSLDLVVEAVRLPRVREEGDRDRLAEAIQAEPTRAHPPRPS